MTAELLTVVIFAALVAVWGFGLGRMAALNDPEAAPKAARTRPFPADPGVAPPPPAPGEAGQEDAMTVVRTSDA